jgi:short-subunit dehydrogenase
MRRVIKDKRIIVTGASSGIGRALALEAGRRGARVVVTARSVDKLRQAAKEIEAAGGQAVVAPADLTSQQDRESIFRAARDRFGGLDVLINNAGVGAFGHFIDLGPEILRQVMEVNFFAVAENCRLAIPLLAETGVEPIIVNLSSMCGRRGVPAWTEYSASKFAVCGFSEALRAELARFDIDLLLVIPGLTNTDIAGHLLANKGRQPADYSKGMPPAVLARRVFDAIVKNKKEIRLERQARMLLFANWLMPRVVDRQAAKVVRRLYADEIADRLSTIGYRPSAVGGRPSAKAEDARDSGR